MMQHPDPDHPLEIEIATQLVEKPKDFEKMALKWTKEHALRPTT
jgi:ubiquitin-protein ligase